MAGPMRQLLCSITRTLGTSSSSAVYCGALTSAGPAIAAPAAASLSHGGNNSRRGLHNHAGRLTNPWDEVLRVAKSSSEKLHEIVDALTTHCIKAQAAPPLDQYNELLRICEMHGDLASVHKLCQMACAVRMHLDHNTYERLQSVYTYFPRPYTSHLGNTSSSSSVHKGSFAGRDGLGPSTAQHGAGTASATVGAAGMGGVTNNSSSRTGQGIQEAPATSSVPSVSATGGASSVSVGGSSSGGEAAGGGVLGRSVNTNVWYTPLTNAARQQQHDQQQHQVLHQHQQQRQQQGASSGGDAAESANAPDATG